jgi:hypothetical protein
MSLWSFQGAHETSPSYTETPAESAGLSKLSSVRKTNVEVDVLLGELNSRTEALQLKQAGFHQTGSAPTGMNFRIP